MSIFTTSPRSDHALAKQILDHVLRHPGDDPRTSTLARLVGVSPRHLNRLFTENFDCPPAAAVRRVRLELAAQLACSTELSLIQIATRCGVGSAETLRQAFVGRFGTSPSAMRSTPTRSAVSA